MCIILQVWSSVFTKKILILKVKGCVHPWGELLEVIELNLTFLNWAVNRVCVSYRPSKGLAQKRLLCTSEQSMGACSLFCWGVGGGAGETQISFTWQHSKRLFLWSFPLWYENRKLHDVFILIFHHILLTYYT